MYDPTVDALALDPFGHVYIGGYFAHAGYPFNLGVGTLGAARWSPSGNSGTWSGMGFVFPHIHAMAVAPDRRAYVGGAFMAVYNPNDQAPILTSRIAQWTPDGANGGSWQRFGTGLNGVVRALAVGPDGVLYVGGEFTTAGCAPSPYFARWQPASVSTGPDAAAPGALVLAAHPNPSAGRVTVQLTLPVAGPVRVGVYDLLGREVARLANGEWPAGEHALAWDGSGLAPGVYVVRAAAGDASAAKRVTLAR